MEFRDILKDLRFEKNVTQGEVAKSCGLTSTCICQLETGARNPTGSTVIALAKYFDVSADYLLGLTSDDGAGLYSPPTAGAMHDSIGLTEKEKALLKAFKNLLPETQDFVLRTAQSLSDKSNVKTLNKN